MSTVDPKKWPWTYHTELLAEAIAQRTRDEHKISVLRDKLKHMDQLTFNLEFNTRMFKFRSVDATVAEMEKLT